MRSYDFISIGSGPAGQRAAVQAAKLGVKVALVSSVRLGGVCINTGTVPSKTLREAIIDLSGLRQMALYGVGAPPTPTIQMLFGRTRDVMQREREVIRTQLERNGIDIYEGFARFEGPNQIAISGETEEHLTGRHIAIAVGTLPRHGATQKEASGPALGGHCSQWAPFLHFESTVVDGDLAFVRAEGHQRVVPKVENAGEREA